MMAAGGANGAASLSALEASVNSILLNIASVFNETSISDSERLAQTKHRLHANLPPALNDFHTALDGLESEITSAKAVLSRDLALLKGVNKAPADAPTAGEPSQLDGLAFEMIEKPSEAASNTESPEKARAAPSSTNTPGNKVAQGPQLSSVAMEKTESMSKADIKAKEHVAEEATVSAPKADSKADVKANEDAQKKSVADEQAVASKAKVEDESKTSPNDGNEQASDNGFNELLPGLSMYANDPGNDPPPLLEMDTLNDQSLSNAFGDGGENTMEDFEAGLFGDGDIGANSFADMISFDDTTQNDEGQNSGALDVFDENFFNLSGE